jgi:hypothetical protein
MPIITGNELKKRRPIGNSGKSWSNRLAINYTAPKMFGPFFRSQILAFGNLLALQVTGKTDPVEVKNAIDGAVRKLLNELREYKPRDYYRRQRSIARLS